VDLQDEALYWLLSISVLKQPLISDELHGSENELHDLQAVYYFPSSRPVLATWSIRSEKSPLRSERPRRKGEGMSSGNEPGSWGKDAVLQCASAAGVMATWNIRSKKDGLGFPDHAFPLARNSMEGQWERVLLAG